MEAIREPFHGVERMRVVLSDILAIHIQYIEGNRHRLILRVIQLILYEIDRFGSAHNLAEGKLAMILQ